MSDDLLDAVRDAAEGLPVPARAGPVGLQRGAEADEAALHGRVSTATCWPAAASSVPGVAVSSDFIVGFCGETEESFERTCDLVREAGFKNSFIFKYSPRPGTKADELFADDVPEEVKKRRNNDLLAIQNAVSLADHRGRVGETVEVLVEGPSKNGAEARQRQPGPMQLTGRTMTDHIVVFDGNERLIGRTVRGRTSRRRRRSRCSARW